MHNNCKRMQKGIETSLFFILLMYKYTRLDCLRKVIDVPLYCVLCIHSSINSVSSDFFFLMYWTSC